MIEEFEACISFIWDCDMTAIMINVPDQLAKRLRRAGQHLPQLLNQTMDLAGIPDTNRTEVPAISPFMQEVADFLISSPTAEQIIAFKASPAAQARVEELLEIHREEALLPQERAELDSIQSTHHLLIILKAVPALHCNKSTIH